MSLLSACLVARRLCWCSQPFTLARFGDAMIDHKSLLSFAQSISNNIVLGKYACSMDLTILDPFLGFLIIQKPNDYFALVESLLARTPHLRFLRIEGDREYFRCLRAVSFNQLERLECLDPRNGNTRNAGNDVYVWWPILEIPTLSSVYIAEFFYHEGCSTPFNVSRRYLHMKHCFFNNE